MQKILPFALLLLATIFSGCQTTGGSGNTGRNTGAVLGAIVGGIAGNNMGDGSDTNVVLGAIIGGVAGGMAGNQYDKRRESLEAADAQRQYEYEQEVR